MMHTLGLKISGLHQDIKAICTATRYDLINTQNGAFGARDHSHDAPTDLKAKGVMTIQKPATDRKSAKERIAEYEAAVKAAERNVAARFARGNVRIQLGQFTTTKELELLSKEADDTLADLQEAIARK